MSAPVQTTVANPQNQIGAILEQAKNDPAQMQALMDQLTNGGQTTANANTTTPQALAAPQVQNPTVGSKVLPFLKRAAEKFFKANGLEHDFSAATSVLSFVGQPVLDKLKGKGRWSEARKTQYLSAIIDNLNSVANDTKPVQNQTEAETDALVKDAIDSITYIAQNVDHKESTESGISRFFSMVTGGIFSSPANKTDLARAEKLEPLAQKALLEVTKAKPADAIRSITGSFIDNQDLGLLKSVLDTAVKADPAKAQTGITLAIGEFNADRWADVPRLNAGKKLLQTVTEVLQANSINNEAITSAIAEKLKMVETKLTDLQS